MAEGFAVGHRFSNKRPEVVTAQIWKSNVAMFLTDRGESEAVLFERPSGVRRLRLPRLRLTRTAAPNRPVLRFSPFA
jgi:hypothetical protein